MNAWLLSSVALVPPLLIACTPAGGETPSPSSPDAPGSTVDARPEHGDASPGDAGVVPDAPPPDAPPQPLTMFPINGPTSTSPVIASVTVSCHAQYSPKVVRVYVVVTDAQGASDRGSGSGTLELPDGTLVGMTLAEPPVYSQYDYRVRFGASENLTLAQYDATCAAEQLELSLTMSDKTGHVTVAPSIVIAPSVGGTL